MDKVKRALSWIFSLPTLAEYNHPMEELTWTEHKTSDQNIENSKKQR